MPGDLLIAIVDDDESAREATVDLVRALGFTATGFDSATALLRSEYLRRVSCLVADVRMPGMGGFELYLELSGSGIVIPTILMTAHPDERICAQALEAGVNFYLVKPLEADRLLFCIETALGRFDGPEERRP
jgi:FixJ family two-component response regulator